MKTRKTWSRMPTAAVILLLAACSQGGPKHIAIAPVGSAGTPTMSVTTAPPGTTTTVTAGQQRVLDANASLTAALFDVTSATSNVKATGALGAPRQGIANSLSTARTRLSAERSAAFGSVRSCTSVRSSSGQVQAAARAVATGRTGVMQVTAAMRKQVSSLTQAVATLALRLAALKADLAAEAHPPTVVSVSDVQSAIAAAKTFAADTLTTAAAADASASAAVTKANSLSAQALTLAAKTC
ncbi:MAG: hypothetical protein ABI662_01360 [Dermatophilaceae bacterium]